MTWLPTRPVPSPGESLHSLMNRGAALLAVPAKVHMAQLGVDRLAWARSADTSGVAGVAEAYRMRPTQVRSMTLERWDTLLTGYRPVGLVSGDPFGWALPNPLRYCPPCQAVGRPRLVSHQLGTAVVCHEHRCLLLDARTSTSGSPGIESEVVPASQDLLDTQQVVDRAWEDTAAPWGATSTSTRRSAQQLLLDLRAVTALRFITTAADTGDASLSHALHQGARAALSAVDSSTAPRTSGQSSRHVARLHRPPSVGFMAATLAASLTAVDTGDGLHDLIAQATLSAGSVHPLLPARILPYTDHLARRNRPAGSNPGMSAPAALEEWTDMARRVLAGLRPGVRPGSVPAQLCHPSDRFCPDWARPLTRAVTVLHVLTGRSWSTCVEDLGHPRPRVTAVRLIAQHPPGSSDETAMRSGLQDALEGDYVRDLVAGEQAGVVTVPTGTLTLLHTRIPGTRTLTAGKVAAAWLWTHQARSPVVAAPFIDGRAARQVADVLTGWDRAAAADDKLTLTDANTALLRQMTDTAADHTPRTSPDVTEREEVS